MYFGRSSAARGKGNNSGDGPATVCVVVKDGRNAIASSVEGELKIVDVTCNPECSYLSLAYTRVDGLASEM